MWKIFLIIPVILFLSLSVNLVLAADQPWCSELTVKERSGGLVPCGRPCDDPTTGGIDESDPCTLCLFFVMIERWIDRTLFLFVPVTAVLMIVVGGIMYIVAQGKPEMLSKAKSLFTAIVFGLLIIYGGWLLINTFFMIIGVAEWTGLREGWWQINCGP